MPLVCSVELYYRQNGFLIQGFSISHRKKNLKDNSYLTLVVDAVSRRSFSLSCYAIFSLYHCPASVLILIRLIAIHKYLVWCKAIGASFMALTKKSSTSISLGSDY